MSVFSEPGGIRPDNDGPTITHTPVPDTPSPHAASGTVFNSTTGMPGLPTPATAAATVAVVAKPTATAAPDATTTATTAKPGRIYGVDLARGIALVGMFAAHTFLYTEDFNLLRPATWFTVANGRSSILFATLLGVSLALITGGAFPASPAAVAKVRARTLVRAVFLFALGSVLQAIPSGIAVILPIYAVLMVAALPFLRWPPKRLFILAGGCALIMPVLMCAIQASALQRSYLLSFAVDDTYPALIWFTFAIAGLGLGRLRLDQARTCRRLVTVGVLLAVLGYGSAALLGEPQDGMPSLEDSASSGAASASGGSGGAANGSGDSSDSMDTADGKPSFLSPDEVDLTGMACIHSGPEYYCQPKDVWDAEKAGAITTGVSAWFDTAMFTDNLRGLTTSAPHSGTPFEIAGSSGVAFAVLGLCLLAGRRMRQLLWPVAAAGTMSLTLYTLHILLVQFLPLTIGNSYAAVWAIVTGTCLAFGVVWARWWGRGPVERFLRWLTAATLTDSFARRRAARPAGQTAPGGTPDQMDAGGRAQSPSDAEKITAVI